MFVAYNIPPDSVHPALTDDIFEGRLPLGDYFYYVACADADVVQREVAQSELVSLNRDENRCIDGARVTDSSIGSEYTHVVLVTFDKDLLEYGQSIIDYEQDTKYDNFNVVREQLGADKHSIQHFMDRSDHSGRLDYKMDHGDDWAATFSVQENDFTCAEFEYVKVAEGRMIQIRSRCQSTDTIVGDLVGPWLELIEKYKGMPMNVFHGAERW